MRDRPDAVDVRCEASVSQQTRVTPPVSTS